MSEKFFSIPKEIIRLASSVSSGGNNAHAELKVVDLEDKKAFMLQMASVWIQEDGPIENLSAWMVVRDDSPTPRLISRYQFFRPLACMRMALGSLLGLCRGRFQYKLVRSYAFRFNGRQTQGHCPSLPKHGVMPINKLGALTVSNVSLTCSDRTA